MNLSTPRPAVVACRYFPGRVFFVMRTLVLIDGQNLFHLAKTAWTTHGVKTPAPYGWPSYDVGKLANALTNRLPGRHLVEIRFYTGVPNPRLGEKQRRWYEFWNNKLRNLRQQGVYVYRGRVSRGLQEKGVDVSLAIDLVQATHESRFDCAIIVSQDWDFGPAARLAKSIAKTQGRSIEIESAFPVGPCSASRRGVPGTTWVHIDKTTYDACFDPTDYRPKIR